MAAGEDFQPGYTLSLPSLFHLIPLASWLLPLGMGMKTTLHP